MERGVGKKREVGKFCVRKSVVRNFARSWKVPIEFITFEISRLSNFMWAICHISYVTSTLNHWQNCVTNIDVAETWFEFQSEGFLLSHLFQFFKFFENFGKFLKKINIKIDDVVSWLINNEEVINNGWAIMQILPRRNAKCHNKFIKFNCSIFIFVKNVENETCKECWVALWEKLSFIASIN